MHPREARALLEADRRYVWHPFTQMKDYEERDHLLIERAEGMFLYDADGRRYYDTNASWWVNVHGHAHPRIRQAIARQLERMDHVMFSGYTHEPGVRLAERLVAIAPEGLSKVFYSDNGSTAVEVGLKMSFQYWRNVGRPGKTKFVYMENSYHGDTLGAVSVGGVDLFHGVFRPLLFDAYRVASPNPATLGTGGYDDPEAQSRLVDDCLREVELLFKDRAGEIAGFVVEPLVQAAGGIVVYPPRYLAGIRRLCDAYGVHLIADEVATGFGRTGTMFACEQAGVSPDIMCVSKGLTAGIMPLSATLSTEAVYQAFYGEYAELKTFFHGHSFTGNPLAAAVALESLQMFDDSGLLNHVQDVARILKKEFARLGELKHAARLRAIGTIAALDLLEDPSSGRAYPSERRVGWRVYWEGLKEGLLLRPLGDTLYVWLPLCVSGEQVRDIVERTYRVLRGMEQRGEL